MKTETKFVLGGICAVVVGATAVLSFKSVPANNVGIKYSKINGTSTEVLSEGIHYKVPFVEKIYLIDTKVQERTDKDIAVQTKDAQWVKIAVNVKYSIDKKDAFKIYKNYGTLEDLNKNIVGNYTQESLNQVCSQFNVIDILGEHRNEVVNKAEELLRERFKEEGIILKALTVKDMDAGKTIEKAIADEAVAKKAAETAIQKQEQARAEAETKRIEAQGQADANRILSESISDELIKMKEAEARIKHGWVTVKGEAAAIVKE